MDKAYNLKDLGQKISAELNKDGIAIAEEAMQKVGKAVYFAMKAWAKESAALTGTPIDDFLAKFYDLADPLVMEQLKKIDLGHNPPQPDVK